MAINQELDKLYHQWIKPNRHFVKGGVVDENRYLNSNVKVLFLQKEVNDPEQLENWSLVDHIHEQINTRRF